MVSFSSQGVSAISAASDHDLFLALGYVHARFRLAEMDEERRLGEGRLAQLAGPTTWPRTSSSCSSGCCAPPRPNGPGCRARPAAQALAGLRPGRRRRRPQVGASGQWPAAFTLAAVPFAWAPVDSLVIQGELTEELDFTSTPLDYRLVERSLGAARTMACSR